MDDIERNLSPEMREFEINQQVNAVARAVELLGKDGAMTVDDVIEVLAKAETDAKFLCGFVALNGVAGEKKRLEEEFIKRGFATLEGGYLKLTDAGRERTQVPLPPEIEAVLK